MQVFLRMAVTSVLWLAVVGTARAAACAVQFGVATNYYAVTGATPAQVFSSLRQARLEHTNRIFDALTTWSVNWNCKYSRQGRGVRLEAVEITGKAAVTMPSWITWQGAPEALIERWRRYHRALAAHEEGHVALAREAVNQMRQNVAGLSNFASAAGMWKALEVACSQVVEKARQKEQEYDAETDHGAKQGVVF